MNNMYSTFSDVISPPDNALPTSCGWKLIEDPAEYSFVHKSYFIVSEAGIAWDQVWCRTKRECNYQAHVD